MARSASSPSCRWNGFRVPGFDPVNPLPFTYAVGDDVQPGWVKAPEGHFAPPPVEPALPAVPAAVTMRQARLALLTEGLLAQVNTASAALPSVIGEAARIE
ncbi:MAG: hypothetical protein LBI87_11265 [Candidatus Accumulibacter sp.]|jgi:hypothetical protein|nr:hypothetical protein [Accumulibacter sp.]